MSKNLNEIMDFDHVIKVNADGTIEDNVPNAYAPTLTDGELDSKDWELISHGYTGQFGYNGPIMHPSEILSGLLEIRILTEPGVYVCLVAYSTPDDYDESTGEMDADGWAVAKWTPECGEPGPECEIHAGQCD